MKQQLEAHVISYPKSRHFMEEAIRSTHHKPMMHGLLEVDVTTARAYLREVKARTGDPPRSPRSSSPAWDEPSTSTSTCMPFAKATSTSSCSGRWTC
jgi:hypothetical protein